MEVERIIIHSLIHSHTARFARRSFARSLTARLLVRSPQGGEVTITGQPYEGSQNVLVLKCVEQSKTKMLSFPSTTAMNSFQKAAEHVFSISPQDMGHRQALKLLTTPITHYDHLTFPPHESNLPDPNLAKQATVCYATGHKFSMFGKSARCDCCGNGFSQDQVSPFMILLRPP